MKEKFRFIGFILGVIAWFIIEYFVMTENNCTKSNSCGGGDLLLFGILSIGNLAPAYVVMSISSIIFPDKK
jgi:hypothetical protein